MRKVYTHAKPNITTGETFPSPSLTDQLADEPIEKIINRFMIAGGRLDFGDGDCDLDVSAEKANSIFDDLTEGDLRDMRKDELISLSKTMQEHAMAELSKAKAIKIEQNQRKDADVVVGASVSPTTEKIEK